ncbi:hypothetical protein HanRHA438_Chr02g0055061 [Helianthus annuus]|nr:hypothetical protein HanRHA438_Chr02g0055061 [Helianthus annuus]
MFKDDVPDLEDPPVQWMSVYKVVDQPMCPRFAMIIPGLLRTINRLQVKVIAREDEIRKKKTIT